MATPAPARSTPSPLARLPHALVHSIFTYALVPSEQRGWGQPRGVVPEELKQLALVAREWNEYARDVASVIAMRKITIAGDATSADVSTACTRSNLLEIRRRVTLRRAFLRELEVKGDPHRGAHQLLSVTHWLSVMSLAPQLQVLNLKWTPRKHSDLVASLVWAARTHCSQLKSVQLPGLQPTRFRRVSEPKEDTKRIMSAVLDPVAGGGSGGSGSRSIQELRVPIAFLQMADPHAKATEYLAKICAVHPLVEKLDGYVALLDQNDRLACDEQWRVDEATWETFCATCCKLKSFDWVVVPFMTTFFEIFGRYKKPQLDKLTFSTAMDWDWDQYFRGMGRTRPPSGGFGASARNADEALKACPALKDVEVAVYLPGDEGDEGDDEDDDDDAMGGFGFGFGGGGGFGQPQRVRVPQMPMMDQEIFGDVFCETLSTHCKQLERFTIWRVLQMAMTSHTILSFTDRALRALATLPLLCWCELKSVNITGDGLFDFVACFAPDTEYEHRQREYVISVGDAKGTTTEMAFYETVEQFLTRLAATKPNKLICASRRVALRLQNGCFQHVDATWSSLYLDRVRKLAIDVMKIHSTVRVRVLTRGYRRGDADAGRSDRCNEVVEFGFYTVNSTLNSWWGWVDEPQDTRIDEVVLNRGPLAGGGQVVVTHDDDDDNGDDDDEDDAYYDEIEDDPYTYGGDDGYDDDDDADYDDDDDASGDYASGTIKFAL